MKENEIQSFYGKLSEVEKECPEGLFLRIHKSCLINLHYTKEITYKLMNLAESILLKYKIQWRIVIIHM